MTAPNRRPSVEGALGNHEKRISTLESIAPTAGAPNISAQATAGLYSHAWANGANIIYFIELLANDPSFGVHTITTSHQYGAPSTDFRGISITREGFYLLDAMILWASNVAFDTNIWPGIDAYEGAAWQNDDFAAGVNTVWDSLGATDSLQDNTFSALGHYPWVVKRRIYFNFTAADWGQTPLVIGLSMQTDTNSGAATSPKSYAGDMTVTWLGDPMTSSYYGGP